MLKRMLHNLIHVKKTARPGFSLVEVLLYMAMLGLFSTVAVVYWFTINDMNSRSTAIQAVQNDAQAILTTVDQLVRNATVITSPAAGTQSTSRLEFQVTDATLNPAVLTLNNGNLTLTEGTRTPEILNSSRVAVTGITFTNASNANSSGVVRIQLTLSYRNSSGRSNLNYSQTYYSSAALK